jgi:hypothetical protein
MESNVFKVFTFTTQNGSTTSKGHPRLYESYKRPQKAISRNKKKHPQCYENILKDSACIGNVPQKNIDQDALKIIAVSGKHMQYANGTLHNIPGPRLTAAN